MLPPPVTVPIAFVRGMVSGVHHRGGSPEALLKEAGIAAELLLQPHARVTALQYSALFRLVMERLGDEGLGFFSRPLRRGSLALIARSALDAGTLGTAIRRVSHTFGLLQDDALLETVSEHSLQGVQVRFTSPAALHSAFLHELLLRVFWRLLAWLAGGKLDIARFEFAFSTPPYSDNYGKIFPAALRFDQAHSAFWFDAASLAAPIRRDNAALRLFLADAQAQVVLPTRQDEAASARVRQHLSRTQPGWPDLDATAAALHLSASTLQRRLASEGTCFQLLKDELRRDLAITRLDTSSVPLAALAYELGFSDSGAFQRAFKSWTGSAPGSYRRRAD